MIVVTVTIHTYYVLVVWFEVLLKDGLGSSDFVSRASASRVMSNSVTGEWVCCIPVDEEAVVSSLGC